MNAPFLSLLLLLLISLSSAHASPPPPNDLFTNATVLQGSSILLPGTNVNATAEPGEPRVQGLAAQRSVWYRWQAPADGKVVLNATNAMNARWRVSVFTGDFLTNLSLVAINSRSGAYLPATFDAEKDREYRVAVDVQSFTSAPFWLTLNHYRAKFEGLTNGSVIVAVPTVLQLINLPPDASAVRYFTGTNLIGESAESPFSLSWLPEHTGTNALSATIQTSAGETNYAWPINVLLKPANDFFENAFSIPSDARLSEVTGEMRFASNEAGEPSHGLPATRTLWWRWTPNWNALVFITNQGAPVLNAYAGSELTNLVLVENLSAQSPTGSFSAMAGTSYYFQLDGYAVPPYGAGGFAISLRTLRFSHGEGDLIVPVGATQRLSLTNNETEHPLATATLFLGTNAVAELAGPGWSFDFSTNVLGVYEFRAVGTNSLGERRETPVIRVFVSPTNDLFENAILISSHPGLTVVTGSLAQATHELWEEVGGRLGSTWYRWVAPFTAEMQWTVESGAPEIRFFTGDSSTNLTLVTNTFEVPLKVYEGTNYYIAVDAYWGSDGPFQFTLHPPPANDHFSGALEFSGVSGAVRRANLSAGAEEGEIVMDPSFRRSIWFKWTSPRTGDLMMNTRDSLGFTAQFAAYTGSSISNLQTAVAPFISSDTWSGWRGIRIQVDEGTTYYFRLSGYNSSSAYAELVLNYDFQVLSNQPSNDRFSGAVLLAGLTNKVDVDVANAWNEPGEPPIGTCNASGRTVWYQYVPEENGTLRVTIVNGAVAIYRGTSLVTLEQLGTSCTLPAYIPVQAGESYFIQVDTGFAPTTEATVGLLMYPPPPNDDFENATRLEGSDLTIPGQNYAATLQPGELKQSPDASGKTVWLSWLAPSEGRVVLRGFSSHLIGTVQVYQGSRLTNLVKVPSIWDNWQTFYAGAGEVYHLQLDGGGYGDFTLTLKHEPFLPVTNDHFADSTRLAGSWFGGSGSVIDATMEMEEPIHSNGEIKSIWWHWQAPISGQTSVRTEGSMVPCVIAIYKGDQLELIELVGKGTNNVAFSVVGGTTYRIAVATAVDARGLVTFQSGGIIPGTPVPVTGNILPEGDFENTYLNFQHWQVSALIGGYVNEPGGADGGTWPVLQGGIGTIWQDFATIPGEQYQLRFAVKGENAPPYVNMRVTWDGVELGTVHIPGDEWNFWHWTNHIVTAASNITRLKFENLNGLACLDAVSVVWLNEPPSIITEPRSISAYAGGGASFSVGARGIDPKNYQWYFDGETIPGETNRTLFLETVSSTNAGTYYVQVQNRAGSAQSREATLTVQTATAPVFILQPAGDTVLPGSYHVLASAAIGTPPLQYQWFHNGEPLINSTNREIVFENIHAINAGQYTVQVSNYSESVLSLSANLRVSEEEPGGGVLFFMNYTPALTHPVIDARIFDVDGATGLNGTYVAQIYAGRALEEMRPAGQPQPFLSGFSTGVVTPVNVTLANVAVGEKAFVQVRAWDPSKGASFEIARALGGKFGRSEVFEIVLDSGPTYLAGLKSFSLQAGLPEFDTGRLVAGLPNEEGIPWTLQGEVGFKYLIERAGKDFHWRPYLVIENEIGSISFSTAPTGETEFYRSRILD